MIFETYASLFVHARATYGHWETMQGALAVGLLLGVVSFLLRRLAKGSLWGWGKSVTLQVWLVGGGVVLAGFAHSFGALYADAMFCAGVLAGFWRTGFRLARGGGAPMLLVASEAFGVAAALVLADVLATLLVVMAMGAALRLFSGVGSSASSSREPDAYTFCGGCGSQEPAGAYECRVCHAPL